MDQPKPLQTAASESEEELPVQESRRTLCAFTWNRFHKDGTTSKSATAVSWLKPWVPRPGAPEAGTGDPAATAVQTIAELVTWTHRLQKGRTDD